jgi:hypothetical protein
MKFKKFLQQINEMPYILGDLDNIVSPSNNPIEVFDAGLENISPFNFKRIKVILDNYRKRVGEVPIYSKSENIIFIWDYDNKKSHYLKTRKDKELAGILLNGMYRHALREKDTDSIKRLKNLNQSWSPPIEIYDNQNI